MTPRTFADLLAPAEHDDRPILIGSDRQGDHHLTIGQLRRLALTARRRWPTDRAVVLYRSPGSPEAPLAGLLVALLAAGIRVYLPARLGATFGDHLDHLDPGVIVSDRRAAASDEADRDDRRLASEATKRNIDHLDLGPLLADLGWPGLAGDLGSVEVRGLTPAPPLPRRAPRRDQLCLTTSGSTGAPRALRYDEAAWMRCGAAFAAAGLLDPEVLGGPGLCPGLAHSMGVRAVLLSLWTRQPLLFIQPEWSTDRPAEVIRLLRAHPPTHLTGGPALARMLPRLAALDPAMHRIARGVRVLVSSGAPFDPGLPALWPAARVANAFGTSETQQISTTLLDPDAPVQTLGRPLPGVQWRVVDGALEIDSPFGARGPLGGPDWGPWYAPGDRVELDAEGRLRHVGRVDARVSTGLGVEIDLSGVERRYRDLPDDVVLVLATHSACPGLLGLAFTGARDPADPRLDDRLRSALSGRAAAHPPSAPFDADRLYGVACVGGPPPAGAAGKIDRRRAIAEHAPLLDALAAGTTGIALPPPAHPTWPQRAPALAALGLDWQFVGGVGDTLFARRDGREVEVLDLVGGFGVNLLGHGNTAVRDAARRALDGVPIADQVSDRRAERRLSHRLATLLAQETGRAWSIALASTGAEAVDLALRHALLSHRARIDRHHDALRTRFGADAPELVRAVLARNRATVDATAPVLVALDGGFHGTTITARSLLDADRRSPIGRALGVRTVRLSRAVTAAELARLDGERLELETLTPGPDGPRTAPWRPSNLLAVVAEAVQGEGGVHLIADDALTRLATADCPLIIDEIQAGLGRTGHLVAPCAAAADILLFGKALGGGVAKIAAVAIRRGHLEPTFDALRGSTFAGDRLSCTVAATVLDEIERLDVPRRAARLGIAIAAMLERVRHRHPDVIAAVRGTGLLHGIELAPPGERAGPVARLLADRGWGMVAASWLLHRHQVRVLPTTGAPRTLRIEPSAVFETDHLPRIEQALDGLCATLRSGDLAALIGHWGGATLDPVEQPIRPVTPPDATRVAFIHPLTSPRRAALAAEPSLSRLDDRRRRALTERILGLMPAAPLVAFVHPLFGGRVVLEGVTICAEPAVLATLHRRGEGAPLQTAIQRAVDDAAARGARTIVLGGYVSVVTDAGRTIHPPPGTRVVTGNTFTVAVVLAEFARRVRAAGIDPDDPEAHLVVLGAAGNIGRALATALAQRWPGALTLVGRPGSSARLEALREDLLDLRASAMPSSDSRHDIRYDIRYEIEKAQASHMSPKYDILVADDLCPLTTADVIVSAVSSPQPLDPQHLAADRPVLLVDVSVPSIIPAGLRASRPQVRTVRGGMVRLPADPALRVGGLMRPGALFACAAEGVLLALDGELDDALGPGALVGPVDSATVERLARAGRRHGLLRTP